MRYFIVIMLTCFYTFSQDVQKQADSLKNILNNSKFTYKEEIEILNKLTLYYGELNFAEAKVLNYKIYTISKKNNYIKGFGFYFQNSANNSMLIGNYQNAEKNAKKAQYYFNLAKDNNNFILSVYSTCFAYDFQGRYKEAEKLALQTIRKFEGKPNSERIVELYYYISTLYNDNKKPKIAFIYINKAAELYRKSNNQNGVFKCNYQLASICYFNGMYNKSIDYLNKFYTITNPIVVSKVEYNIKIHKLYANNYIQLKNFKKALVHCQLFYDLAVKNNITSDIKNGELFFGEIYTNLKQYDLAFKYLIKLDKQENTESEKFRINSIKGVLYFNKKEYKKSLYYRELNYIIDPKDNKNIKFLAETEFQLKNFNDAYNYLNIHLNQEVSDLNQEKNNQVDEFESLFKLKEKDFEIQNGKFKLSEKERELQKQKQRVYFIVIGFIVLLIVFLLLVYSYRVKQKNIRIIATKNEELIELNLLLNTSIKEKELLLKEIHHRVKNNLQLVMSLLNIQALDAENISLDEFIENGRSRIVTMSLIHESLYQTENFRSIDFQNYLLKLVEGVSQTFKAEEIEFKINTNKLSFDLTTAIPLALIINELVCNALKHAFTSYTNGKIEIEIHQLSNQFFELRFGDNGVGTPLLNENSKSIGLEIVSLLVMQLKGKITKLDAKGTLYSIEFKEIFN
jgi:two-component sensor histidine kinase